MFNLNDLDLRAIEGEGKEAAPFSPPEDKESTLWEDFKY